MKIAVIGSTMMDIVSYTDTMPQAGETRRVSGFHIASARAVDRIDLERRHELRLLCRDE